MSYLRALLHSQSHVLGFHLWSLSQEPQSSNSLHSTIHSSWFHFCFELYTFSLYLHLHSQDSFWTKNHVSSTSDIKFNTLALIFFTLFEIQTQAYNGSSILLHFPSHLLILTVNWQKWVLSDSKLSKKSFVRVHINKCWVAWHGRSFKDTHFKDPVESEASNWARAFNNPSTFFNTSKHYFMLITLIKYLWISKIWLTSIL